MRRSVEMLAVGGRNVGHAVRDSSIWTWQTVCVVWQWVMAPLVDGWKGLSLTRFIAIFGCVVVGHEIFLHEKSLSWVDFWTLVLSTATAFGKMAFQAFLQRIGLRSESQDRTESVNIRQEIVTRREQGGQVYEPSP